MAEKNLLIVDDEEDILKLLEKRFLEQGYRVLTARRGREAIEKARAHKPDVILMDIVMPDLSGPEAVKTLRDEPATQSIPIIFISGIVSKEEEGEETGVHVDGIKYHALAKPFSFQELLKEVKKNLGEISD